MSKSVEEVSEVFGAMSSSSSSLSVAACSSQLRSEDPRRNLIHDIVAEPFQVHLRIRPLTSQEKQKNDSEFCHAIEKNSLKLKTPVGLVHEFKFTNVFDVTTNQTEIFDGTTLSAVKEFIDGQNHVVFSYGVTNSGKTHTMQGSPTDPGIIPRALEMLFRNISHRLCRSLSLKPQNGSIVRVTRAEVNAEKQIKEEVFGMGVNDPDAMQSILMESINASIIKHSTFIESSTFSDDSIEKMGSFRSTMDFVDDDFFSVFISYVEIYNEKVYDLLAPIKGNTRLGLNLQENRNLNLFVKGVREICVDSVEEALKLLVIGQQNLKVASTKLNYSSSRSHSVYTIKVLRMTNVLDPNSAKISQLCFCDLAGSERYTNTQNVGDRLKEAGLINTSLLVLGRCVTALRHNQLRPKEPALPIPFRESKLTRILQGFFTGKGKALMIVNISPCERVINETYHVLRFSALAKEIVLPQNLECLMNISKATKLSLDLIRRSITGKESIDWESPRTSSAKLSLLREYNVDSSQDVRVDDTIEEEEEEESNSQDYDNADEIIAKYWGIIETLREKLIMEHKEKAEIEMRIRDEMGDNFLEVLQNREDHYSKRMAEQKEMLEELASKRIQNTVDYYKTLVDDTKEGVDEVKEKVNSLEAALKASQAEMEKVISDNEKVNSKKERVISELESKVKILESFNLESEKMIDKLEKEILHLKMQLKHLSRETQSSMYFSMINTGSSSSEGSHKEKLGNATVYGSPCGTGDITKSTSDDVFFKSPLPVVLKMDTGNVEDVTTVVANDAAPDQSVDEDSAQDQSVVSDVAQDQSVVSDVAQDQSVIEASSQTDSDVRDMTQDESVSFEYEDSSFVDMSSNVEDTSESRLHGNTKGETVDSTEDSKELHSVSQQTDLIGNEISFVEHQQDKLQENVSDLEEIITKLECTNGLLQADVAHSKVTIDDLKETVQQLETKLQHILKKSVLDASSQTDLTGDSIVAMEEQLCKAESKNKENSNRIRLMEKREAALNKEMDKLSSELTTHDEVLQTFKDEKKTLQDKLIAETSKCNRLQQQLDKMERTKQGVITINSTVSESDFENCQLGPSNVKTKRKTPAKKPVQPEDSESDDDFTSRRTRSKTAPKRVKHESRKRVKVEKEEEEEEVIVLERNRNRTLRPKVKKVPVPNQMLTTSPKKDVSKEAKSGVHKQVMRELRARK